MTQPQRLNDNEVAAEMNKMVSFIKQEALEKAREIKVKADEEFNIEKAKLVRQETIAIEAFYQKKIKQAEVSKKIAQSNHVNKNRLRVLEQRQQVLNDLFQDVRSKLFSISDDPAKYQTILKDLLLQLLEKNVVVQHRKKDSDIVALALEEARIEYKEKLNSNIEITLDKTNFIPESSAGGVVVSANDGRFLLNNTLEARLDMLSDSMLPDIRIMLFGVSTTRAFYN
ncbi:V-ATPase V1 sector subunit E [Physocladia obscura]|uniref:V-ATPase V1 sector subunit E n=1 Tax=Physocladia obscura TaxID=109957 RepID=A0AAD5XG89_9FUNG|nr:V-ATPase V1 sector subunit E [Physocladia obscura]